MLSLTMRQQLLIAAGLVLLMIVTRGHNPLSIHALPSASWAVFFLAGVYLNPRWSLAGLFILVWAMDFSGYTWSNGSDFCLQSSYLFLLASYAVYFVAGYGFARTLPTLNSLTLVRLGLFSTLGGALGYFISSASFHFLSGRHAQPSWDSMFSEYISRLPSNFENLLFYVGLAALIHVTFSLVKARLAPNQKVNQPHKVSQ